MMLFEAVMCQVIAILALQLPLPLIGNVAVSRGSLPRRWKLQLDSQYTGYCAQLDFAY